MWICCVVIPNEESLKTDGKDGDCIGDEEEEPLFWYALADTLELWSADTGSKKKRHCIFWIIRKQNWHAGKMTVESKCGHGCER